jgi:hypothetical protein
MSHDSASISFACDHNLEASEMTCTVAMTGGTMDTPQPQTKVIKGAEILFHTATIAQGASLLTEAVIAAPKATPAANGGQMLDSSPMAADTGAGGQVSGATRSATGSAAPAQHTGASVRLGFKVSTLLITTGTLAMNFI